MRRCFAAQASASREKFPKGRGPSRRCWTARHTYSAEFPKAPNRPRHFPYQEILRAHHLHVNTRSNLFALAALNGG